MCVGVCMYVYRHRSYQDNVCVRLYMCACVLRAHAVAARRLHDPDNLNMYIYMYEMLKNVVNVCMCLYDRTHTIIMTKQYAGRRLYIYIYVYMNICIYIYIYIYIYI
jgi:hypothetical protein